MKNIILVLLMTFGFAALSAQSVKRQYTDAEVIEKWTSPSKADTVKDTVELGYYYIAGCVARTNGSWEQYGYLTGLNDTCTWTLQYIACNHRGFIQTGRSWASVTGTAVEVLPGRTVAWYFTSAGDYGLYARFRLIRWRGTTQNFNDPKAVISFIRFD